MKTLVFMATLFTAGLASAGEEAQATRLFNEGRAAMKAGDLKTACQAFERSHELDPALGTLLNLASCLEKQGHLASAWLRFNEALAWSQRTHEADREAIARTRSQALKPQLAWLTLSAPADVEVSVDGAPVALVAGRFSLPVDLGLHTVRATRAGAEPWAQSVTVSDRGATVAVAVPSLISQRQTPDVTARASPTETAPSPGVTLSNTRTVTPIVDTRGSGQTAGVALTIAGGLVAVGGAVGLAWSLSTYSALQAQRVGQQVSEVKVSEAELTQLRWVYPSSWVALSAGIAAVGGGVALMILNKPVVVTPVVTTQGATLSLAGSF